MLWTRTPPWRWPGRFAASRQQAADAAGVRLGLHTWTLEEDPSGGWLVVQSFQSSNCTSYPKFGGLYGPPSV